MALNFTELEAEVTRNETVDGSASALLTALFNEVEAAKNNPAVIQAIVDRVRSSNDALAAAVAANTPTSTVPPVVPPVVPPDSNPAARRR